MEANVYSADAADTEIKSSAPDSNTNQLTKRITRRFLVEMNGDMHSFESMGKSAATWQPVDNCHTEIFGAECDSNTPMGASDQARVANAIANAQIVKATILQSSSTFPVPLGLTSTILQSKEMNCTGQKFLTTVLPNMSSSHPEVLYEADMTARQGAEWREHYRGYNKDNLDTQGVMEVKGCPYVFVSQGHPAINLLRANSDLLGSNIAEMNKIDGEWYKVSRQVVMQCNQTLRNQVLNKEDFMSTNLNSTMFQLQRFHGQPWTSLPNEAFMTNGNLSADAQQAAYAAVLMKPCSYNARVEITFEIQA